MGKSRLKVKALASAAYCSDAQGRSKRRPTLTKNGSLQPFDMLQRGQRQGEKMLRRCHVEGYYTPAFSVENKTLQVYLWHIKNIIPMSVSCPLNRHLLSILPHVITPSAPLLDYPLSIYILQIRPAASDRGHL